MNTPQQHRPERLTLSVPRQNDRGMTSYWTVNATDRRHVQQLAAQYPYATITDEAGYIGSISNGVVQFV